MIQVVKKSDMCVAIRTYTDKEGNEKKVYKTIGEVTTFKDDEGKIFSNAELYHMPGVKISLFEQKPREEKKEEEVTPF